MARLAYAVGKSGKPSIAVNKNYDIFIGNEGNTPLQLDACELFGFNLGSYDQRIVRNGENPPHVIPWRLGCDLDFVYVDQKLVPLCNVFHACVTEKGLAEIILKDHEICAKFHPVP